ncbi:bifunctional phosphopantothenoylcysteine decarboxylase/phosphopantothenate--cysteine ligase CoaBC [Vibrio albus]|jgi:phosphopantothenoylcysteine decarboxylase/phosphopantothenate--cysteine ligase|uniref:Coenzyme A biosynthesis bifunctional protein CoaBC n=1 Tax=Vibrio albus TaxID=2200953 RepID=A0A2U3B8H0_9VIBR|nr:bifunctional phosphopantothenoylcysteine decarboxylase/phosphopantothenate--cysteine ligase CoaBC [Vibrio albus]PWI33082.1 bifunctional phosphopantothenoylcysteine decarboxylase/phosphopantothenate--cysteine ligase CoaBC [Vibrio albus]
MQTLTGKNILLGISGGIAAYKCAELTRRLMERGAEVHIVMTEAAKEFITPLTMQAISGHPVAESLLDPRAEASMSHIELAKWADMVLLAPATADLIARVAAGMGNDLVSTAVLATDAPVVVAPAMNQQMYQNIATQENIATLSRRGMHIWGPDAGEQACGDVGPGRMLQPMDLVERCEAFFQPEATSDLLKGKSLLLTAGPTREALDPVRYITNHSSGKMGYALAQTAAEMGANVTLVSGPVAIEAPAGVSIINVDTAQQMHQEVMSRTTDADIFIGCAAVADYRPEMVSEQKMKKADDSDTLTITMVKNPDIIASVSALKTDRPFTVGFAAETQNVEQYALSKLERKNLDMICANDVSVGGQGFNSDDNALTLYWRDGKKNLPLDSKLALSREILVAVSERLETRD